MAGRKTDLTKTKIKEICKIIKDGNYDIVACKLVGISQDAFYDWYNKGKAAIEAKEQNIYREFAESLDRAKAQAEDSCVKYIKKHKDWKARSWYLSRKFGERWGDSQEIKHTGSVNITKDTDLTEVSEEDLLAALTKKKEEKTEP